MYLFYKAGVVLDYIEVFIAVSAQSHKMSQRNSQSDGCQSKLGSLVRHRIIAVISLVPDFRFIRSLNLHAGPFLESLVTFVRAGVGLSHVTIAHTFYESYFS
jgi:hypothetical protein